MADNERDNPTVPEASSEADPTETAAQTTVDPEATAPVAEEPAGDAPPAAETPPTAETPPPAETATAETSPAAETAAAGEPPTSKPTPREGAPADTKPVAETPVPPAAETTPAAETAGAKTPPTSKPTPREGAPADTKPAAETPVPPAADTSPAAETAGAKTPPPAETAGAETPPTAETATAETPPAADEAAPTDTAPADKKQQRGRPRAKLEDLTSGTAYKGRVVGLAKFGAFVDIGAVTDGLVHITEFTQKRVRKVEDAVQLGDEVDVWIKDVDMGTGRVSLSMRKRPDRPLNALKVGDVVVGTVTSTTKYGVFVDIGAETEGLVHISEMSSGFVERPSDVIGSGASVEVRIKEIDTARERISLSMVGLSNDLGQGAEGGGGHEASRGGADEAAPAEPEERMPTVVELALRRALGELQDDMDPEEAEAPAPAAPTPAPERDSLGELYERMLASYKAEKAQH